MNIRTILEAGRLTAFRYRIEGGMDDRDRDEIQAMDSGYVLGLNWPSIVSDSVDIRHRIHYMKRRNLGFGFTEVADPSFSTRLTDIDPRLPRILSEIVSDLYLNGTRMLSDHVENIEAETPRGKYPRGWCADAVSRFLQHLDPEASLDRAFVFRMPAGFEDNFEIGGDRRNGFTTVLVYGIGLEE